MTALLEPRTAGEMLSVIGTVGGGQPKEAQLHRELQEHRIVGEWFRWCPDVERVVLRELSAESAIV